MSRWLEISLPATPDTLDELTAKLVAGGFDSFQIADRRDFEESRPAWELFDEELLVSGACGVVLYLPAGSPDISCLRALCPELTVRERCEEEWADAWKRYYNPVPVGRGLLIQPSWIPLENPEGRAVFINNPGMSFGTGLHATTQLCLEILESLCEAEGGVLCAAGSRVLDIGCGSGILGICALLLGAGHTTGVDIDPTATKTAQENACLNGVESCYTVYSGDILTDAELCRRVGYGYGVIFSNIVADIVIELMPRVIEHLAAGGCWVASGIIQNRMSDVLAAAEASGFTVVCERARDGWCAAVFRL